MTIITPKKSSDNGKKKVNSKISGINKSDDLKKLLEQKPSFGTIRKAIIGTAEEKAEKEFLDAPEQRHIDEVIDFYRLLRSIDPKTLNTLIILSAKGKELKDELGPDLNKIFTQVWEKELTANMKNDLDAAMVSVRQKKDFSDNKEKEELNLLVKELSLLVRRYLEKKSEELKKDPRILAAFAGKEELLDKLMNFMVSSIDIAQSFAEASD